MNKDFLDTIYLFSCGANKIKPSNDFDFDIEKVFEISNSQGVWETVFLAISSLYKEKSNIMPPETFSALRKSFLMRCTYEYARFDFIHKLLAEFDKNGIENCILKGESIARFYAEPIARMSSDIDILINPKKLNKCLDIMKEYGFDINNRAYESHQIECRHKQFGLVEIHVMMYGKKTEDACFNHEVKYNEPYIEVKTDDLPYKTLGITDNFLYLLLHFMKHFLSKGAGMRQLCDVLVYIKSNYEIIDWTRANTAISNLGFKKMFDCIIIIGEKYFMFPKNLIKTESIDEKLIEKIFDDMFEGGVFGLNGYKREGFYDLYLEARYTSMTGKSYSSYASKRKLLRLFPNKEFMCINFPYVKKSILLLPFAWAHRIIKGVFAKNKNDKNNKNANNEISLKYQERLKLLKDLEML